MRTMIYVDGFNLYYGALKGTPYKWLDMHALATKVLQAHNQIVGIKYFTARVDDMPWDTSKSLRQSLYLRALETVPNTEIIFGHYLSHNIFMPLTNPPPNGSRLVKVIKTEEKGTDVNLATHVLLDAFEDKYDCAVIVSGDSDLYAPAEAVKTRLKKCVGVINPQKHHCLKLKSIATFYKFIRAPALATSQFPNTLTDANGSFSKPATW